MKLRKIKKELVEQEFLILHKKTWILQYQHMRKVKMYFSFFFISSFVFFGV